ncbi:MAG: trypsin-like peptidase domain-containing protein [Flavobacteriaceae bacterium]|nr:trypsin-like peptidase domain-containing protein [Flavobacteriaceae bacterium]
MKKVLGIIGIAFMGGAIALGGYKIFLEKPQVIIERTIEPTGNIIQSNYTNTGLYNNTSSTDFTAAAEKTVNAVVHVKNTAFKTKRDPWAEFYYGRGKGTRKYEQVGTGSGVIITPDGYIITNNHVIDKANEIEITLNNQKKYKATLIGTDKANDIALLKINADEKLPYIPFGNSDAIKVGEWVLAVGNPYNLTSTVTAGIISAKGRDLKGNSNVESFIQTDAAVNPGNSGGALVNTRGELIGINTAISSKTGSFVGYSFAVPSNIAKRVIEDLMEFGKVQEVEIGISFSPRGNVNIDGVKITGLANKGGAKKAGLKVDDIIVKVNNVKITRYADLAGQLRAKRPGDLVDVTVKRNGSLLKKSVRLKKKIRYTSEKYELELRELTKSELKGFGILGGAKITKAPNNENEDASLVGYIIVKVNNIEVRGPSEIVRILDANRRYNKTIEMINLKGETVRFVFR